MLVGNIKEIASTLGSIAPEMSIALVGELRLDLQKDKIPENKQNKREGYS
jgi:hypothetical protein